MPGIDHSLRSHPPGTPNRVRLWRAISWVSTGLAALAVAVLGVANLVRADPIAVGLAHLGYPPYLATILGVWYVLAAGVLIAPGLARPKEWAYSGTFFALSGAAASHAFTHDSLVKMLAPLVLLGVVMTSRACASRLNATARG